MRCPTCGNEVNPGEAFCGQCGTPSPSSMPSREQVQMPPGERPNTYSTRTIFPAAPSGALNPHTQMPANMSNANRPSFHGTPFTPNQPVAKTPIRNQQQEFYQDATEAMPLPSSHLRPGYPTPQQQFPGTPVQGGYPGGTQYGTQASPFETGNHYGTAVNPAHTGYAQPLPQAYDYRTPTNATPLPPRQQSNTLILIVSICLVGVLISVIGLATLYISRNSSAGTATPTALPATPTTAIEPTATVAPTPTLAPTPTVVPTVAPTPAPDAGFLWCGPVCTNYGFTTEYPSTWQPGATPNVTGIQFANPAQPDQFAAFKAEGATNSSAGALVTNDLQTNFANRTGYVAPTTSSTATISGETWATAVASYQNDAQQPEHVEVYATVHQGKAYIIELEAPEAQFASVNAQVFTPMLGKFQFLPQGQGTP